MKNKLLLLILTLCLSLMSVNGFTLELPKQSTVPGGIAIISINMENKPEAYFYDRKVMIVGESNNWKAIVGIPLSAKPGTHKLVVKNDNTQADYKFDIKHKGPLPLTYPADRRIFPAMSLQPDRASRPDLFQPWLWVMHPD